jgi:hypothetical protein
MAQNNISNFVRDNWVPTWNGQPLGYCDDTDPGLTALYDAIGAGTLGKIRMGDRFVGLEGDITLMMREPTLSIIETMIPWGVDGNGEYLISPPINTDMYTYAQLLNLQPSSRVAASDHTLDLNLVKAVPIHVPNAFKLTGKQDDVMPVKFRIYPLRTALPAIIYGYIGAYTATP